MLRRHKTRYSSSSSSQNHLQSFFSPAMTRQENNKRRHLEESSNEDSEEEAPPSDDNDDDDPTTSPTMSFRDTMHDLAHWWCHAILHQHDHVRIFDELGELLEFLAPLPEGSPLCVRLQCVAVWQELLQQTTTTRDGPPPLEDRDFSAMQDKLILTRSRYFASDDECLEEYKDVLRMIRVHHELCHLYERLDDTRYSGDEMMASLEETLHKGRDEIYFGLSEIPMELAQLVVKENGWTWEQRRHKIVEILLGGQDREESELSVRWLKIKTQLLLLHWCEQCIEGGAPELVKKKYGGVGILTRAPNHAVQEEREEEASHQEQQQDAASDEENNEQQHAQSPPQLVPSEIFSPKRRRRDDENGSPTSLASSRRRLLSPGETTRHQEHQKGNVRSLRDSQSVNSQPTSSNPTRPWTAEEDEILRDGIAAKGRNWITLKGWAGGKLNRSKKELKQRYFELSRMGVKF
jgi:hypothetical protein